MRPRRNRPLFIIDIAMPRDVEPAAGEIEQVFLYNIDDLQATVAREPRAARERDCPRRGDRRRGGREVRRLAAIARRDSDRRRAAPAVRGDPPRRARAARVQAVGAAARGPRPRRRNHAAHRREAAAARRPSSSRRSATPTRSAPTRKRSRACSASARTADAASPDAADAGATTDRREDRRVEPFARPKNRTGELTGVPRPRELRLGTRGSQLALWQANRVAAEIAGARRSRVRASSSSRPPAIGCRTRRCPKSAASGSSSRRSRTRSCAARSTSPCTAARTCQRVLPDGLAIGAVLPREDPRDAVVLPAGVEAGQSAIDRGDAASRTIETWTNSWRCLAARRRSAPAASAASRSSRACFPARGSRRSAATSTRGSASSTRASTTRWSSPPRDSAGSGSRRGSRSRFPRRPACRRRARASSRSRSASDDERDARRPSRSSTTRTRRRRCDAERALVEALGGGCQTPIGALASPSTATSSSSSPRSSRSTARAPFRRRDGDARADAAELGAARRGRAPGGGRGRYPRRGAQRVPGAVQGLQP